MKPEEIREPCDANPFVPFRICLTDGNAYDVPHRDVVLVSRSVIDIGVTSNPTTRIYHQIVRTSPLHIVRIENLQAA